MTPIKEIKFKQYITLNMGTTIQALPSDPSGNKIVKNLEWSASPEHADQLIDFVLSSSKCKVLQNEYFEEAMRTCSYLLYLIADPRPGRPTPTLEGVILFTDFYKDGTSDDDDYDEIDHFYVDYICGSSSFTGVGEQLMRTLEDLARGLGRKYIELESLTSAVGFYAKQKFRCSGDQCKMIKGITSSSSSTGGRRSVKRSRTTRRRSARKTRGRSTPHVSRRV